MRAGAFGDRPRREDRQEGERDTGGNVDEIMGTVDGGGQQHQEVDCNRHKTQDWYGPQRSSHNDCERGMHARKSDDPFGANCDEEPKGSVPQAIKTGQLVLTAGTICESAAVRP